MANGSIVPAYRKERGKWSRLADVASVALVRLAAIAIIAGLVCLMAQLIWQAIPAMRQFGLGFLISSQWNPVAGQYGVLPQVIGTIVTAFLAMIIAVPIALGAAIFLSENFLSERLRTVAAFLIELLAAVPSVVYGLWGIFVLIPLLREPLNWLHSQLSWFPLLSTPLSGPGVLPAVLVLAIMVLPTIAALSRDALMAQPQALRHGSYALGATRWETILNVLLPACKRPITAAIMLGLGRAMGETMAVAMLIGNSPNLSWSLLAPGTTIPSHLANQFGEASGIQLSALMFTAVILLLITAAVNFIANRMVRN